MREFDSERHVKIAIFDYVVTPTNAIGSCHLRILKSLCYEHEFTVFAVAFENPCPDRIHWVRIPAPSRPLLLLFVTYQLVAPLYYWFYHVVRNEEFDLIQIVESTYTRGDLSYAHFCHRAYLKDHWRDSRSTGIRGLTKWLVHRLAALFEPHVFRRVGHIVVPSRGLARELSREYPWTTHKIQVLSNPVDVDRMRIPENFDRDSLRREMKIAPEDLNVVFLALGHFERKGFPLLLEAVAFVRNYNLKVTVVGGTAQIISAYRKRAKQLALDGQVVFLGIQRDVRPYLWCADAFALPSFYEVFPLVVLEAAAAGLPLLVTNLNGVEEFLIDGQNGFIVEKSIQGVVDGLNRLLALSPECRKLMGKKAQLSVQRYSTQRFVEEWQETYEAIRSE